MFNLDIVKVSDDEFDMLRGMGFVALTDDGGQPYFRRMDDNVEVVFNFTSQLWHWKLVTSYKRYYISPGDMLLINIIKILKASTYPINQIVRLWLINKDSDVDISKLEEYHGVLEVQKETLALQIINYLEK